MRKVLIIDDEGDLREIASMSLRTMAGWETLVASSGKEGLAVAEREKPDAILLDVMMPEVDGVATFHMLHGNAITRGIPVVLLTAKIRAADKERFAQLAIRGVIEKPFDPVALPQQISAVLGWGD
jgi:CheY-like chemotaxis protein